MGGEGGAFFFHFNERDVEKFFFFKNHGHMYVYIVLLL